MKKELNKAIDDICTHHFLTVSKLVKEKAELKAEIERLQTLIYKDDFVELALEKFKILQAKL